MNFLKTMFTVFLLAPNLWATEIIHDQQTFGQLGRGYLADQQDFGQFCIVPQSDNGDDGFSSGTLSVVTQIQTHELEKELGFGAGGRYKAGVAETKASAEFLKKSKSNGFSLSYTFRADYVFPRINLTDFEWTNKAKSLLKVHHNPDVEENDVTDTNEIPQWDKLVKAKNPEVFYQKCGDEVVTSQTVGAKLYFTIRVTFSNQKDYNEFKMKFKFTSPTTDLDAKFQQSMSKMKSQTNVTVSMLQIGGQVDKITSMFSSTEEGPMQFVRCSSGEIDQCYHVLAAAIKYASDKTPLKDGGTGFPAQIDPNKEPGTYGGPSILASRAEPYKRVTNLIDTVSPQKEKLNLEIKGKLEKLFDDLLEAWVFASQIRETGLPRLNPDQEAVRNNVEVASYKDIQRVADGIDNCFDDYENCDKYYDKVNPANEYGVGTDYMEQLKFEPATFAALCDMHVAGLLDRNLNHTVEQMMRVVGECYMVDEDTKVCPLEESVDPCGEADTILAETTHLDLSNKEIQDLTPLKWLPELISLDLSNNKIGKRDLSPLLALKKLEVLKLSRNNLKEVGDLAKMDRLLELYIDNNRLTDISELGNLKELGYLNASSNKRPLSCPFEETELCVLVDFKKVTGFSEAPNVNKEERLKGEIIDLNMKYFLLIGGKDYSHLEVIDKDSMVHTQLDMKVNRRYGATYARIDDNAVLVYGGMDEKNVVVRVSFDFAGMRALSEVVTEKQNSRYLAESIVLQDGRILITGGFLDQGTTKGLVVPYAEIYDPFSNEIYQLPNSMNISRVDHRMILSEDGKVYIFGGKTVSDTFGERPTNTVEVFDPKTETFMIAPEVMNEHRFGHSATLLDNGDVLIAGGFNENVPNGIHEKVEDEKSQTVYAARTAEIYNINSSYGFTLDRTMNGKRANHQAVKLEDGSVLFIGGQEMPGNFSNISEKCDVCNNTAEIYTPQNETFSDVGHLMSYGRVYFDAVPLPNRRVYINGGVGKGAGKTSEIFHYRELK